jgi:hypothetical protein
MKDYRCLVDVGNNHDWNQAIVVNCDSSLAASILAARVWRNHMGNVIPDDCDYHVEVRDIDDNIIVYYVRCKLEPQFYPRLA